MKYLFITFLIFYNFSYSVVAQDDFSPLSSEPWYTTTAGIRFSPSCFALAKSQGVFPKMSEADFIHGIDHAIHEIIKDGGQCIKNYPELRPYLVSWRKHLKQVVITCSDTDSKFGALTIGHHIALTKASLIEGIVASAKWKKRNPVYAEESKMVLFHEILHSTGIVDNRGDHNLLQFSPRDLMSCNDNRALDRAYLISGLCSKYRFTLDTRGGGMFTNGPSDAPGRTTEMQIFRRISGCGLKRGCEDIFSGEASRLGWGLFYFGPNPLTSSDLTLPQGKSSSLCKRISNQGRCDHLRLTQSDTLIRSNSVLLNHLTQLKNRFSAMLPDGTTIMRRNLIEAFPKLTDSILKMKASSCFETIFTENNVGDLVANPSARVKVPDLTSIMDESPMHHHSPINNPWITKPELIYSETIADYGNALSKYIRATCLPFDAKAFSDFFDLAYNTLVTLEESIHYRAAISVLVPGSFPDDRFFLDDDPTSQGQRIWEHFAGRSLAADFAVQFTRGHPNSERFDCSSISQSIE